MQSGSKKEGSTLTLHFFFPGVDDYVKFSYHKIMDMVVDQFPKLVREKLKNHIKRIVLFGSRARGDFNDSSDYDFLVIVDKKNKNTENTVLDVSGYLLSEFSELIGFIIWDENEWEYKKKFPIGLNIEKEGREI